jgi:hypothetical protein
MKHTTNLLLLLSLAGPAAAQVGAGAGPDRRTRRVALWDPDGPACILGRAGHAVRRADLPPPHRSPRISELYGPGVTEHHLAQGLLAGSERPPKLLKAGGGAQFLVVYSDPSGFGFWDPVLGPDRRAAFEFAAGRVVAMIDDPNIVVSVDASMAMLGVSSTDPLASASATQVHMDSDFPFPDALYGEPLASHLADADPDTDTLDITAQFNSSWDFSSTPWFYGTGMAASNEFHFVNVALHELLHGLDFSSSLLPSGALLNDPYPFAFDLFLEKTSGSSLVDLPDMPITVTGGDVVFDGGTAEITWKNHLDQPGLPPIFAPTPYQMNSSMSHFDEAVFVGAYDLMSPAIPPGQSLLSIDPITRGVLTDLGWNLHFEAVYVTLPTYGGPQTGKPHQPFITVTDGLSAAASEGKDELFLSSGSHDVSSLVIDQPVTLHAWPGVTVLE